MSQIYKSIQLDVARENDIPCLFAKQGDANSRFLNITLCNEGQALVLPQTAVVTLNAEKPDKDNSNTITAGVVNPDGTITVELTNQTLAAEGLVHCDVTVLDGDEVRLSSMGFSILVQETMRNDNLAESTSEFQALDQALVEAQQVVSARTQIEADAQQAQTAAIQAKRFGGYAPGADLVAGQTNPLYLNRVYKIPQTMTGEVTLSPVMDEAQDDPVFCECILLVYCNDSAAPTVTFDTAAGDILWKGGIPLSMQAGKTYMISLVRVAPQTFFGTWGEYYAAAQ